MEFGTWAAEVTTRGIQNKMVTFTGPVLLGSEVPNLLIACRHNAHLLSTHWPQVYK
jgi:hypothetical protein